MTITKVKDAIAANYGYLDFADLWINGDITQEIIDDLMELYGNAREHQATKAQPNMN